MSISVGICGVGAFADSFIPLFRAHPLVNRVVLCDINREKLAAKASRFDISYTCPSLDDLCESDVDAIAIFTQNWLHGPQAVQSLRAGKHTYSAVPPGITVEEIANLVRAVEETGLVYMLGETSYYRPATIYCRERFGRGDFGRIIYGEAGYYHDWDHGLYEVAKWRGGEKWRETAGVPPMYYPTHSTSMIMSVTGAYATHVSCFGVVDVHEDGVYDPNVNMWQNAFSNQSALLRMSDGSVCRINEFRRVGHPGAVSMCLYGTEAGFEEWTTGKVWVTKNREEIVDLTELLAPVGVPVKAEGEMAKVTDMQTHVGASAVHDVGRLPKEFIGLPNGHEGSHQFLVDDFVKACVEGAVPPNDVWWAARYMLPGIMAHESAVAGGKLVEVPDFGRPETTRQ
jgi:predicted dehydrogenase